MIWDISVPLSAGLPTWPGDPPVGIERISDMDQGDEANVSRLAFSAHCGTHIDAPVHFIQHGAAIDALSLETLIGPAMLVEIPDTDAITPAHLERLTLPSDTRRLLMRTRNSLLWHQPEHAFFPDFVALTSEAAAWVVAQGIQLIGIDYLSIQSFHDARPDTHCRLLEAGVIIVEGLDLRYVPVGRYELICLPLKLVGSDGAPARVVLRS
jgi:arylformamidase